MSFTRQQWAQAFLVAIGAQPSTLNTNWVIAWTQYETSCCGGCAYNLLNTEESNTPGIVGNCNSVGVKNFASFADGIIANAKVLMNGLYPNTLTALRSNNQGALCSPGSAIQAELGKWGTGHASQIASAACSGNVQGGQSFSGTPGPVPPGSGGGGSTTATTTPQAQTCIYGVPGQCPDTYQCFPIGSSGLPLCSAVFSPGWAPSRCFPNSMFVGSYPCDDGSGKPTTSSASNGLPSWLQNPNWSRVLKVVGGIIILGIGLLGLFWPQAEQVLTTVAKTTGVPA